MKVVIVLVQLLFVNYLIGADDFYFDQVLNKHLNSTSEDYEKRLPQRDYTHKINFDPTKTKFFDFVSKQMQMNKTELEMYKKNGFVSIDHGQRYSFGSAYYAIYTRDLPVLITTDSILHAMHKSFDTTLIALESRYFLPEIDAILTAMHNELEVIAKSQDNIKLMTNLKDVDLYLTVARNLIKGAGADIGDKDPKWHDQWSGNLIVKSKLAMNKPALEILNKVTQLKINSPVNIYGKKREIDFSQFRPRGHYTKFTDLKRYFRTMMWLGRADCGFNVIAPNGPSSIVAKAKRGARNSVVCSKLLTRTKTFDKLENISKMIDLLVGQADNVSQKLIKQSLEHLKLSKLNMIADEANVINFQNHLISSGKAQQKIRSQLVYRDPLKPGEKAALPGISQFFGQRFIIDSFILSKVVYDSIEFNKEPVKRMMPKGLDVMAALGNDMAGRMLSAKEMKHFPYAANMMACEDYVKSIPATTWKETIYNQWLGVIRELDVNKNSEAHFPQVMKTKNWRLKQLQTQLASWSQLRHDTVLYAKQSYTAGFKCVYPKGYVEPYPEVYKKIGKLAESMAACIENSNVSVKFDYYSKFWKKFAHTQSMLATLAEKELKALPFTAEEEMFIKKTIDRRGGGSGGPRYDGWFADLFLNRGDSFMWEPEVVDVHTNPDNNGISECLEVGTGNVNFIVVAIDNGEDKTTYVGPAFSYYEFIQSLNGNNKRLTDGEWGKKIIKGDIPLRPEWTTNFQAPIEKRTLKGKKK